MALTGLADFITKLDAARKLTIYFNSNTVQSGSVESWFTAGPNAGSTPTTSVTLTDASAGAAFIDGQAYLPTVTGTKAIATIEAICSTNAFTSVMLIDRLVHQGGLVTNIGTAQTTNLPTTALPSRATGGLGVWGAVETYTATGATPGQFDVVYTNSAGTGSRQSRANTLGPASAAAGCFRIIPFADGDLGIQTVDSFTTLSSTGTAGNVGITLFKPIIGFSPANNSIRSWNNMTMNYLFDGCGVMPTYPDDACLQLLGISNTTGSGAIIATIKPILT